MDLNLIISPDNLIKLVLAILFGGFLGIERQLHAKAAGFRTITIITIGSTLFTILSLTFKDNRIIANIVPGIGFLGAGVILLNDRRVTGLTTAASIWVAAAIGSAIGVGDIGLALAFTIGVLFVLRGFVKIEEMIDVLGGEIRNYEIQCKAGDYQSGKIENALKQFNLTINEKRLMKDSPEILALSYVVRGSIHNHNKFSELMMADINILGLRY